MKSYFVKKGTVKDNTVKSYFFEIACILENVFMLCVFLWTTETALCKSVAGSNKDSALLEEHNYNNDK